MESEKKYMDFYQKLRKQIREQLANRKQSKSDGEKSNYEKLVDCLIWLPDLFHLAVRLILDKNVPVKNKGAIVALVVYTISPIDLIPDFVSIAGWVDDFAVLIFGLDKFLEIEDERVTTAVKMHWAGDEDVFRTLRNLLSTANAALEFLPRKLISLVKDSPNGS